jgi:hypothetical protein
LSKRTTVKNSKRPPKINSSLKKKKNLKKSRQFTKETSANRFFFRIPSIKVDFEAIANQVKIVREYLEALHLASESLCNDNSVENDKG